MASAPSDDDMFDQFLSNRGHETEAVGWDQSYNKLQCPDCGGLHDTAATECSVCGWVPDE
ncbi:HVO_0416 family zinc finger protein [Halorientalis litorea]|jgi:rubredoxin|uniref:HVO_0416 family zinc finger protein n=1 Tax=Halorientalis litorea TaxID=2931977 RepID=UPI001FF4C9C5|nr:HVO_0416 family zinc finger protein [Halorientalis litorea]